jgi:hypothetical protein
VIDSWSLAAKPQPELFRDGINFNHRASHETPVIRVVIVSTRVPLQHRWRVVRRVKGNRKKMPVGGCVRGRHQPLVSLGKIVRHARAKLRKWTTGEDKSEGERFAFEFLQAHGVPEFVGESIVRHQIADF